MSDEAHLQIQLGELELPVRSQILIAHATRHLVVAVDASDHAELLEQLWTLRQCVETARMQTAGDHEVTSTFGS